MKVKHTKIPAVDVTSIAFVCCYKRRSGDFCWTCELSTGFQHTAESYSYSNQRTQKLRIFEL